MAGFVKGDRVVQPQYGSGTIVEANEHHTVIDFDTEGVRRFVTRLVTL
jgi:RNA polymerase-interacting CarD/CdnL/TRCF family regulator